MHVLDIPTRIYDSRESGGPIVAGQARDIPVGHVDLAAVEVNVTVTGTRGAGFVVAYGGKQADKPNTSTVNWSADNQTAHNCVPVATHGDHIHVRAAGTDGARCDLVVDLLAVQPE